jgi:long-subunit acyl-CoA synthetase (AMP-forming)
MMMTAAQCLGGVPVPLYQDAVANEMLFVLQDAGIRFVVVEDQEQVDKMLEIRDQVGTLEQIIYDDPRGMRHYSQSYLHDIHELMEMGRIHDRNHADFLNAEVEQGHFDDTSVMLYTSGTTGKPKGFARRTRRLLPRHRVAYKSIISAPTVTSSPTCPWPGSATTCFPTPRRWSPVSPSTARSPAIR